MSTPPAAPPPATDDASETELRLVRDEADRQARIFDTTLSAIVDFAYTFDRDGRFIYVNRALLDLWGLTLAEAVGKNFFDLAYPDDLAARLQRQIQQVIDTGVGLTDETPYTSPTGAGGYYEYIFAPVFGGDGKVEVVAGSTRDITGRKQMEDQLREVHARLETAIAAGSVATVTWHIKDDVMVADERLAAMFGIDPDQAASLPLSDYLARIHPDDRRGVADEISSVLATDTPYEMEYRVTGRDGQVRWVQVRGKLERDEEDNPLRFPAALIDITERKEAEGALQAALSDQVHARQIAEAAVRAREEFMSVASHELRNPIATIFGTTQLIGRAIAAGTLDAERLARYTATLESSGAQLARLTDDLLDVSRLQHGSTELRRTRRDIGALVGDLVAREPWAQHVIAVTVAPGTMEADVDPDRIEQIVANLLDNAVKYSPEGPRIGVTVRRDAADLLVEVTDAGLGLAPGFETSIFEAFGRGPNEAEITIPGLGLGLYLSRGIARQHGGELSASSPGPGKGTTMTLRLPAAG